MVGWPIDAYNFRIIDRPDLTLLELAADIRAVSKAVYGIVGLVSTATKR